MRIAARVCAPQSQFLHTINRIMLKNDSNPVLITLAADHEIRNVFWFCRYYTCTVYMVIIAFVMNRFHKNLGVLHIVKLASWLRFAEGAAKANHPSANQKTAKR